MGQYFPNIYIGHLELFLLFQHLSSEDRNHKDVTDTTTQAQSGALATAVEADRRREQANMQS